MESSGEETPVKHISYTVDILNASKDGEIITFTIQTKTNEDGKSEGGVVVLRQYDDFEYLSHCLLTHNDIQSTVVPALPPKPIMTPAGAETKTKKQLGKETKTMVGDDYSKDCRSLQKYLELVVAEPKLNGDQTLKAFLTEEKAPVKANVKKGFLTSLKGAIDDARFHHHKDIDEEFQTVRTFTDQCAFLTKSCNECYKKLISANLRCSFQLSNVTSAIRSTTATDTSENDLSTHLVKFAAFLDEVKRSMEKSTSIEEDTLGFTLDLYSRYVDAAKEMLFRRTCKLVEFENASKALEKAKPKTQQQLQVAKEEAESSYEQVTERSRDEIKKFHSKRVDALQTALVELAEQQILNCSKSCQLLSQAISELKEI